MSSAIEAFYSKKKRNVSIGRGAGAGGFNPRALELMEGTMGDDSMEINVMTELLSYLTFISHGTPFMRQRLELLL